MRSLHVLSFNHTPAAHAHQTRKTAKLEYCYFEVALFKHYILSIVDRTIRQLSTYLTWWSHAWFTSNSQRGPDIRWDFFAEQRVHDIKRLLPQSALTGHTGRNNLAGRTQAREITWEISIYGIQPGQNDHLAAQSVKMFSCFQRLKHNLDADEYWTYMKNPIEVNRVPRS